MAKRKNLAKGVDTGQFVLGSDRFAKISEVEGIHLTPAMKKRASDAQSKGLTAEESKVTQNAESEIMNTINHRRGLENCLGSLEGSRVVTADSSFSFFSFPFTEGTGEGEVASPLSKSFAFPPGFSFLSSAMSVLSLLYSFSLSIPI